MRHLRTILTSYFSTLYKALLGYKVYKDLDLPSKQVQFITGLTFRDIEDLNKVFPIQLHKKGMTFEDHVSTGAEQKVIQYLSKKVSKGEHNV